MKGRLEEFSGAYEEFDWDEVKRLRTTLRGIDFADVARCFFGRTPFFRRKLVRNEELRWQAFGEFRDPAHPLSVVYTERADGKVCRLISVRAASPRERAEYHAALQAG